MRLPFVVCLLAVALPAVAQDIKPKPVEQRAPVMAPAQPLHQQQRVSEAYRELQKALYEVRFAEQDYLNAQDDDKIARGRAQAAAEALAKATKSRDAAKAKEAAARKRYDDALNQ